MKNTEMIDDVLLSVNDLVVDYETKAETVHAVDGISFQLKRGESLGLVGETGAGKTTIAKSIMQILPDPPAVIRGGEIHFKGNNLLTLSEKEMGNIRGKWMSMIFQDPMTALNPVKRVGWQIAEGIKFHEHISWKEANERAAQMLEMVGIPRERFREFPHQFSGGMKQRVVIAIALACNPDLLIADEPTTALDVTIQAQVLEMITQLQKRKNTAMILITHDFGIVAETCDNIAVVYGGEIIEYGTTRQIFKEPRHPYTQGLFGAIPKIEEEVDRLKPIDGLPPDPTREEVGCKFADRCPYETAACAKKVPIVTSADGHQCRCIRIKEGEV